MSQGSRIIESKGARIELVEPWKAGEYDPPMQEWLKLPIGEEGCPNNPSHHWGTRNPRGYFLVRSCADCGTIFRGAVSANLISEVFNALNGFPQRFIVG